MSDSPQQESPHGREHSARGTPWLPLGFFLMLAFLVLQFYTPPMLLPTAAFGREAGNIPVAGIPEVRAAPDAFGVSGGVKMRFTLPGEELEYPLEVNGDPTALLYQWVRMSDKLPMDHLRPLQSSNVYAPEQPGFYHLTIVRGDEKQLVGDLTLAVLVPFASKRGSALNGYQMGTYLAERAGGGNRERPDGFVEVSSSDMDLPLSKHFKVADFITRDDQLVWPRYTAVNPNLLDKLELVLTELQRKRGGRAILVTEVSVNSGFRTPIHNRRHSDARDSRHQYGDAVDVAIDADGDGRFTLSDVRLVSEAVEAVEKIYPELVGGLGVYTGRQFRTPYVHIDARGTRVRWRG